MATVFSHTGIAGNWYVALLVVNTWAEEIGLNSKSGDTRKLAKAMIDKTNTIVNERIIPQRLEVLFPRSGNKVKEADALYADIRQSYYQIIARFPEIYDRVVYALNDNSVDGYLADKR